jgi:hypothetical protein
MGADDPRERTIDGRSTGAWPAWEDRGMADLVRVYSSGNTFDGELTRGRLEAEGIPVMMKGEGEGPYRAGPVDLWVPADREADARAVLSAIERGEFAVDDDDVGAAPDDAADGSDA